MANTFGSIFDLYTKLHLKGKSIQFYEVIVSPFQFPWSDFFHCDEKELENACEKLIFFLILFFYIKIKRKVPLFSIQSIITQYNFQWVCDLTASHMAWKELVVQLHQHILT